MKNTSAKGATITMLKMLTGRSLKIGVINAKRFTSVKYRKESDVRNTGYGIWRMENAPYVNHYYIVNRC
jgi:hypothetical protein